MTNQSTKRRKGKPRYRRCTFMFDTETIRDAADIQDALRAPTASEALRYAVRKTAWLMQVIAKGGTVNASIPGQEAIMLDIPASRSGVRKRSAAA